MTSKTEQIVEIRPVEYADFDTVGRIYAESWQAAYRGLIVQEFLDEQTPQVRADRYRARWDAGSGYPMFIMFVDGVAAGVSSVWRVRDENVHGVWGEIVSMYLLPAYWGRGLGARFLSYDIAYLREQGYERIILWVLRDNARARKAYERAGFLCDGLEKSMEFGGVPVCEVRYSMALGNQ